jgi:hypothetical protein
MTMPSAPRYRGAPSLQRRYPDVGGRPGIAASDRGRISARVVELYEAAVKTGSPGSRPTTSPNSALWPTASAATSRPSPPGWPCLTTPPPWKETSRLTSAATHFGRPDLAVSGWTLPALIRQGAPFNAASRRQRFRRRAGFMVLPVPAQQHGRLQSNHP